MNKINKILMIMLISVSIMAQTSENSVQKPVSKKKQETKIPVVEKQIMEKWLNFLASDSMKGRKNGSPEMKKAAIWIADNFKAFGLKAYKENDGYFQHYFIKRGKDSIPETNVIGFLEGNDPLLKKEYIVISAHFDHLGIGKPVNGDSIYNGANDNASGICGLLGIAKSIQKMKVKPGRSILFAAFSGEELSASGSRYYVRHMNFPVTSIYLNMNIEMIGQCTNIGTYNYAITGANFSTLKNILHSYNKNSKWKLIDTIKTMEDLFFRADNVAFVNVKRIENTIYGVQAHTFVTWNGEDSEHKPYDEVKLINFDNMINYIQYLSGITLYLSDCKTPIEWTDSRLKRITAQ
jgi:hypothetical protein